MSKPLTPAKLGPRFNEAFLFAAERHALQTRKKTDVPYLSHLMSVAALVLEAGAGEDEAIAALLHDVVEDCGGHPVLAEIRERFGDRVANIVEGCTDAYTIPKPPWKARKLDYLDGLRMAGDDVRLVSAADKLHNVRTILADFRREGDSVWERFSGRRDGTLWYYRAVLDVLREGKSNPLVDELHRVVTELETLATKNAARAYSLPLWRFFFMRRTIDMIRSSSVSATVVQAAARGALAVPGVEMIEILVYLANHNKVFGQQARMTLAGWELKSSLQAAANPSAPKEVLDYFIAAENLRPPLLPALLDNTSVSEKTLMAMASNGSREVVEAMRASSRVQRSPEILRALAANPNATPIEVAQLQQAAVPEELPSDLPEEPASPPDGSVIHLEESDENVLEENVAVDAFLTEHARELALEGEKPFHPLGGIQEFEFAHLEAAAAGEEAKSEQVPPTEPEQVPAAAAQIPSPSRTATVTAARPAPAAKKVHTGQETERGSALQKISKLDIKGRIQLAMKGTKEDRSILIRDSTKLVAFAVLESPKVTDGEVEKFANQKNVLEAVLRQIPMKRRFVKNYGVVRNLVANPRTPLDVSLALMKNLLTADLKNLSSNKEVSDTIRKLATKMFKQKMDTTKK